MWEMREGEEDSSSERVVRREYEDKNKVEGKRAGKRKVDQMTRSQTISPVHSLESSVLATESSLTHLTSFKKR
jgi:hypothetical protein